MKGLPPSLRSRKRYIAFRIIADGRVDERMVSRAVIDSMISVFGESFAAGSGLKLEYFDGDKGILRCYREALEKTIIAFTLLNRVGGVRVIPLTLGVSGTIKGCKRYLEV